MESKHAEGERLLFSAACNIGARLCADAVFDKTGRLCNWMGRHDVDDPLTAPYSVRSAALGPELYGGSAGVGLFLAELFGATGDESASRTAQAAVRRSVHYMKNRPTGASPVSFFAGHLGMAYAACRVMDLDAQADLEDELRWLIASILEEPDVPPSLDVIGGCAGSIAPLLLLARRVGVKSLETTAVGLGDRICTLAQCEDGLCRWNAERVIGQQLPSPPMTGFAHGASGLALALLNLYAHTGTARYLDVARGALAFEDTFYSEADCNWVDTRFPYTRDGADTIKGTFQRGWCHGAPGIALARAHAARLDTSSAEQANAAAHAGIGTAVSAISDRLAQPGFDATLCHGIAGISEIVLACGELLDPGYKRVALDTATELVRRYDAGGDWPSGVNAGGPNPSLMIGEAGIGYHLLRLTAEGSIPCILSLLM